MPSLYCRGASAPNLARSTRFVDDDLDHQRWIYLNREQQVTVIYIHAGCRAIILLRPALISRQASLYH